MGYERGFGHDGFRETDYRVIPSYVVGDEGMIVHDPVWGDCSIGDQEGDKVFLDLVHNPLVRRSMLIEQLTLDRDTMTIPGTAEFSRWEHIWGSVTFVRKMQASDTETSPRQKTIEQLRTFVSDLGHTAYSHLGDWMFQGSGGPENQHDQELLHIMEVAGVNQILEQHKIQPAEVVFPETEDWIECKAPDLCVDRVDYGSREIQRWLNLSMEMQDMLQPRSFTVENGRLVLTSQAAAQKFGKAFLLLATEHWSEPVHRLQLRLQEELVKRVVTGGGSPAALGAMDYDFYHPRDLMYTVDQDITREMYRVGTFVNIVRPLMAEIGTAKRRLFALERKPQLWSYLEHDTADYPRPTEYYDGYQDRVGVLPLQPSNIDIIAVSTQAEVTDFGTHPNAVDFYLAPLKPRNIDPPFVDREGRVTTLGTVDDQYASLRAQQADLLQQAYVARLYVNTETKHAIQDGIAENDAYWQEALTYRRMPSDVFKRLLHSSEIIAAPNRMIDIEF